MTTKKQLLEKQQELEKAMEELKKEIEYMTKKKEPKRWRAEKKEMYHYMDSCGLITQEHEKDTIADKNHYALGNYYKNAIQANLRVNQLLTRQKLEDLAIELNKGKSINWYDGNIEKYYIFFQYETGTIEQSSLSVCQVQGTIYCLDKNFLEEAKNKIGEEKLKRLFENNTILQGE